LSAGSAFIPGESTTICYDDSIGGHPALPVGPAEGVRIVHRIMRILIVVLALWLPAYAHAEKLVFATTEFPPFIIQQGTELTGVDVDVLHELCKRVGVEVEIRTMPWTRALAYVKGGQVDGIIMPVYSKERTEYMYYSDEPVGSERISLLTRKGSHGTVARLEDLGHEMVGVVLGYSYGKEFDENSALQKDLSMDNALLLRKLQLGRYQLIASEESVGRYFARQAGDVQLDTVLVLTDNPTYVGISKTLGKRGEALAQRFTQAIREIKQDGTLAAIQGKYF